MLLGLNGSEDLLKANPKGREWGCVAEGPQLRLGTTCPEWPGHPICGEKSWGSFRRLGQEQGRSGERGVGPTNKGGARGRGQGSGGGELISGVGPTPSHLLLGTRSFLGLFQATDCTVRAIERDSSCAPIPLRWRRSPPSLPSHSKTPLRPEKKA